MIFANYYRRFVVGLILAVFVCGAGGALGELSGYLAGFSGQAIVERADYYARIKDWMEEHNRASNLAIMGLAFIPNPFFDLAGIASGALRIPISRFLLFCLIGKVLKMLVFAYAGANWLNQISNWLMRIFHP